MTTTTKLTGFPFHKLADARDALDKAWARLCRAAQKAGQLVPGSAPILVELGPSYVVSRCRSCGTSGPGWTCTAIGCGQGPVVSVDLVDVEVTASSPTLAGWEFLAAIEPLDGGNLIRQVPGAKIEDGELNQWREGPIACDHCNTTRRRSETFIVRADGSDPAIQAGTYKQVGRSCIEAFLGGKSAASIVAMLGWPDVVRGAAGDEDEGGGYFGRAPSVYNPETFLGWVAGTIREDGWLSRGAARTEDGSGRRATADHAMYLMPPPWGREDEWRKERERCAPTAVETERAVASLAWARALTPTSDYERNLVLVARQTTLKPEHAGILASAVSAYTRALGREMERRQRETRNAASPSQHIGKIKDRLGFDLILERVIEIATDYGALNILSMRDASNNLFVWKTGTAGGTPGDRLRLRGTVKKHTEFRGEKQTELTRCEIVERQLANGATTSFANSPSTPPSAKPAKTKRSRKATTHVETEQAA